jgi:surface antigen
MIRSLRLLAALAVALMLGAVTMQPALAATRANGPTPGPDLSQQLSTLLQQLKQQQATVDTLANQVEGEQATVSTLNAKVSADKQQEALVNHQMDQVARIEYERPALTLTTILGARNLGELLSGVAQSRLIAKQQQQLFTAARALKAKDEQDQSAAQVELDKISKQKDEATAIAASTQSEISDLQVKQQQQAAAAQAASSTGSTTSTTSTPAPMASASAAPAVAAGATITLQPGPSNPNRFDPGQCVWYVAQIYSIPWMGNADQWPAAAAADGQAEGMTPVVGAIEEEADSGFGHVAVVTAVQDDNDWTVTEMNYLGPYVTDTRQETRANSNLVTFIY